MRFTLLRGLMALSLTVCLTACTPGFLKLPKTGNPQDQSDLVSNNGASLVGNVRIPSEIISNNGGGIISNNGGSIISNNGGSLISNNGGSYRVSALDEQPLASTLVYLLTPNEKFYTDSAGRPIVATTDAKGAYSLDHVLPSKKQVIVSAMLSGNRRMVGYTRTQTGKNRVDISVATTYVTEFFRAQAAKAGKTMGDYPDALSMFPALVAETQKLLDDGSLPIPDLTLGMADRMNQIYLAAYGSRSETLSNGWASLLGRRVVALSTAAGTYALGVMQEDGIATRVGLHLPTGVAADAEGNLFITEKNHHGVRWVKPDGSSTFIGGFQGDGSVTVPGRSDDGVSFANTILPEVQDITCDPDGNAIVSLQGDDGQNDVLVFLCRKTAVNFGMPMQAGHSYILGSGPAGNDDGELSQASFTAVTGVTSDAEGNLYLADRRNNLIRRIDRATGQVTTVAGYRSFDQDGYTTIPDDKLKAYWTAEQDATAAVIHRPFDVAWKRGTDGKDRLYVWEGTNPTESDGAVKALGNAIREIVFDPAKPAEGKISFLMGGPEKRGFTGDGGPARDAQLNLVDPASPEIPNGGIAMAKDGRHLYFNDALNRRLRVIDLETGRVDSAAGGGSQEGDAEAQDALLKGLSGLATGPDGEVYFCDSVNHVVRKLNRQFGH